VRELERLLGVFLTQDEVDIVPRWRGHRARTPRAAPVRTALVSRRRAAGALHRIEELGEGLRRSAMGRMGTRECSFQSWGKGGLCRDRSVVAAVRPPGHPCGSERSAIA